MAEFTWNDVYAIREAAVVLELLHDRGEFLARERVDALNDLAHRVRQTLSLPEPKIPWKIKIDGGDLRDVLDRLRDDALGT